MIIDWSELAVSDLHHVREYIRKDNPIAAEKVGARIEETVSYLALYPELGRQGRRPNTRELIMADLPYRIVYRVVGNVVQILRVYHTKRKWPHRC